MYEELIEELRRPHTDCNPWALMEQAADALEEMNLTADSYKRSMEAWADEAANVQPRWIPVTERLPESGELVIGYAYARKCVTVVRVSGDNVDGITHWMPLPKLPIPAEEVEI